MSALSNIDWLVCFVYLTAVLTLSLFLARGQHDNDDYFLAGRRMHWVPIGLSIFAGTFSSLSFVGLPSEAAYRDYHLYLSILFIPFVVTPIVWFLFLPLYFRLQVTSAYEYVELRFNRRLRLVCSVLFMLYTIGWMGNLLRAVGVLLQAVFGITVWQTTLLLLAIGLFATVYTTIGGVKAVVWTDALQAVALGGGMLAVWYLALQKVDGGWESVWKIGNEHDRFAMFRTTFEGEGGNLYAACAFGFFVYLTGHSVSFTAVQRFMSMPNLRAARLSLIINGVMVAFVCGLFFVTGSTLFAFYHQQPAERIEVSSRSLNSVDTDASSTNLYDELSGEGKQDHLLPRFVLTEIPRPGLLGILLAGLFAAAMSSVDSGINSMTASLVSDWMSGRKLPLRKSRYCCFLFGMIAIAMAITFYLRGGNVFPLIMKISGMFYGLMLGIFLLGMLVKRANSLCAEIGLVAGVTALTVILFVYPVSHWWYGAVACVPTVLIGFIVSRCVPADEKPSTGLHQTTNQ